MNRRTAAYVTAILVALGGALLIRFTSDQYGGKNGMDGPRATIGGPFTLIDQEGTRRSDDGFRGQLMLVFFGFTHCPDICPQTLANMSDALDHLGERAAALTPLFITIDPERDDVSRMKDYARHFHPRLVALTGPREAIDAVAAAYHVYHGRADTPANHGYLMEHSSVIFLMDRQGRYLTHLSQGASAAEIAAAIERHL